MSSRFLTYGNTYDFQIRFFINNQTFQLNVAVRKTLIIGDNHEGSKKRKQDNWLFNKKLSSAIPRNDIIVYNFRAEFDIALHKAGINKHHPQQVMPDVHRHFKIWSK